MNMMMMNEPSGNFVGFFSAFSGADFVKQDALNMPTGSRHTALAAALVSVLLGTADLQAGAQTTAANVSPNHCPLVKAAASRDACQAARTQFYGGNYMASLVILQKSLALDPKEGILRAMAAGIMNQLGNIGPAERELRQARADGAPDHLVLPTLFGIMIARHEEVTLLNDFPDPAPGAKGDAVPDILQGRAQALMSLDRIPEALAAMDRALSIHRDAEGLLLRARIATRQNDAKLARNLVDEAYRISPNANYVLLAKLGQLELSNDSAGMLAVSDKMLQIYPLSTQCRVFRIRAYLKQNNDAMAKREADAILARRARSPDAFFYKAVLLSRAHDRAGAEQFIMSLPKEFVQSNTQYAMQMAQIALDANNPVHAANILAQALSAAPDMLDVRLRLAGLRMSQNTPQSAQLLLNPVKDSPDPRVKKLLAQVRAQVANE